MNDKSPFFSIIIPTYNRERSIARAIESILCQTFIDFEIIIIDDASKDNTQTVISSFLDDRIIYSRNNENKERCISRNIGINSSRGQYICFLDSDDYHLPNHLEEIYGDIKKRNYPKAFFFTNAFNESADGDRTDRLCPDFESFDPFTYFLRYTVNPQRWAVHKDIFINNLFDPEITICEDMDTSLRIVSSAIPIFQIKKSTTVYVAALDSFTVSDQMKSEKELFYLRKIFLKKELKNNLPKVETNRLLSMCFFHLAIKALAEKNRLKFYTLALKSFIYYPKGYNGKTNKILLVNSIYRLPFIGFIVRKMINFKKNERISIQ